MTISPPLRVGRFIAVAFCMTLVAAGLSLFVLFIPDNPPPTTFENICSWVWLVVSWPLCVDSVFFQHEDPSLFVFILLCIASGLFWAFIVELLLMAKKRILPHKPLEKLISN
jgi:hypothetical protein